MRMKRTTCFRAALCASALVYCSRASAVFTDPIGQGTITVKLAPFVTIPSADGAPQDLVSANDGTGRLFIAARNGRMRVVDANGNLSGTNFLTMTNSPPGISM